MNQETTTARQAAILPFQYPPTPRATSPPKTRVALFGSFVGGCHVLKELLSGELAGRIEVVGLATDDPTQSFTHPQVRLWKYPHARGDELMVPRFAESVGIPFFTGRVKDPEFCEKFITRWQPELCLMATFGQKIPPILFNYPKLGFFNFHHSADTWPSYPGPDPIAGMVRDGRSHLVLTMHKVMDVIDGGEFVARSQKIAIPQGVNAMGMHRITWPQVGPFLRRAITALLNSAENSIRGESEQLHESPIPYRVTWAHQLAA